MTAPTTETRTATVVAHTHWDRAWYLPFQQFRMRLVRLIDRLLDILDRDPDFRRFTLDAQMVVLEDYLEVRPERRADIERHVREGRLLIGPWYVLADEYLVSPESLLRNLERGMREAERFGDVMRVGYTPDSFGHIAQLPQILAGFGIDSSVFWRGLGDEGRELGSEFWWEAPDGTRALAIFLPGAGYGQFNHVGYPARGNPADMPFSVDLALQQLQEGMEELIPFANTPYLLLMVGVDHEEANPHIPEIVREANRRLENMRVRMGSLPEHIAAVRPYSAHFRSHRGELRYAAFAYALQQVYSARMYLKQRNHHCQTLLERYAEPYTAFAALAGAENQGGFLDLAWRELIKNHPHDDICGCSVDPVHRQMMGRFDEVEQVGEVLVRDALRHLSRSVTVEGDRLPLFVFNPNTRPYQGAIAGTLAVPPSRGAPASFSIRDQQGKVVPHQELGRRTQLMAEVNRQRRAVLIDVALALPEIPACGYRTFFVDEPAPAPPTRLEATGRTLRNQYLEVEVQPNGTLRLTDRETGRIYQGLHALEDTEDAGDEYTYSPARESLTLGNADARVEIEALPSGPVRAGLRVHYHLELPAGLTPERSRRSDERVPFTISTDIWLSAGRRRLDFVTRVDNTARDHRLRVLFPTGIQTETCAVDGHFDVIRRPVALPEGRGWREPPSPTAHQRSFVDVSDGSAGLALFNRGLPEYQTIAGNEGVTVALTLLRCVGWLSRGDMLTRPGQAGPEVETPEAQCLGAHEFEYALEPHAGGWEAVIHDAHAFVSPPALVTDRTSEGLHPADLEEPASVAWEPVPRGPDLDLFPASASFVSLEPADLVLSAVRLGRDAESLVVRCYNPSDRLVRGTLRLLWPVELAQRVNFLEETEEELRLEDGHIHFSVHPKSVVTVRCAVDVFRHR